MAWLAFSRDYTFTPPEDRRVSIKFKAGNRYRVRAACAATAVSAGAAMRIKTPGRPAAEGTDGDGR